MEHLNGCDLADTIAMSLNTMGFRYDDFTEQMACEHRTLQDDFNYLIFKWLEKCEEMVENGRYDGRNECRVKALAELSKIAKERRLV